MNRSRRECGVSGQDLTTLSSVTMEGQRFKDWVAQAWTDIQMMRTDWQWMRKQATFPTVVGQRDYTPAQALAPDVGEWVRESFRVWLTATGTAGEQFMTYRDFTEFRDLYEFSSMRTTRSMPLEITVRPTHALSVWPLPADIYSIRGEYYRIPTDLVADTDAPDDVGNDLPARFHMLAVAMTMRSYAAFESAAEVDARGLELVKRHRGQLENWGMSNVSMGGALC